jgi:hypothetical protein
MAFTLTVFVKGSFRLLIEEELDPVPGLDYEEN